MAMKTPPELKEALHRFEPDVQDVTVAARAVVLDVVGPCYECIFPMKRLVSVLYSTTEKRMKDNICLLVVLRDHINLMFPRGVDLNDPKGLLEGTGKAMRHVKIRTRARSRPARRPTVDRASEEAAGARQTRRALAKNADVNQRESDGCRSTGLAETVLID